MIDPVEIRPMSEAHSFKTLRWLNGSRKQFVVRIVDEHGTAVHVGKEPTTKPARKAQFGYQAEVVPGTVDIRLQVLNEVAGSCELLFDVKGTMIRDCEDCDDCTGMVEFIFDPQQQYCPGIYRAQIVRMVSGGYLVDSYPVYFSIEPSLTGADPQNTGMITLSEVRLMLGDNEIGEVSLLDSFEFEDTEIVAAIRWVVDKWNDTPPPVDRYSYFNFPFRYWWLKGTCIELLRLAARRYARNRLAYQAGGVTIDDQNKAGDYEGLASRMYAEFDEWFKMEKRRQNMNRAWSSNSLY